MERREKGRSWGVGKSKLRRTLHKVKRTHQGKGQRDRMGAVRVRVQNCDVFSLLDCSLCSNTDFFLSNINWFPGTAVMLVQCLT